MTILYTVLVIWVAFGLLLYIATMWALEVVELSKQYDEMPVIGKVAFFLYMLFMSPFLFVFFMFKSKGGGV